jgi:phospholipase C
VTAGRIVSSAAAFAVVAVLCGCGGSGRTVPPAALPAPLGVSAAVRDLVRPKPQSGITSISHVVIVMQENRGFNNLFYGYPGADTVGYGYDSNRHKIKLQAISMAAPYDIDHQSWDFFAAYDNGKMDGFNNEYVGGDTNGYPHPEYGYVPHSESQIYFNMANQYVLADRMFTSHIDASFVSHQYIIAAQAAHAVNLPNGYWGCDGGSGDTVTTLLSDRTIGPAESPCFSYDTIGDELTRRAHTWRFYATNTADIGYIWSAYQAIGRIRNGIGWSKHVVNPPAQFLTDVQSGTLANVTWITPAWQNSDHAGNGSTSGPDWVASIVNAVGQSAFWNTTAIFILWDEWGGWYDHVAPPYVDYDGLGLRIPLLIISPYAKQGYVSHVQYEHGSILRFIEDRWGLPQLSDSDARANDPANDCFDFTAPPRPFSPFATRVRPSYFIHQQPTRRAPDYVRD